MMTANYLEFRIIDQKWGKDYINRNKWVQLEIHRMKI